LYNGNRNKQRRQTERKVLARIYIYIQRHGIVHFASGHKYVESGKKTEEQKKRERKKKVIDRYLQEKAKNRENDRKEGKKE